MTRKKDLKKRIRARQRETGERYTTALAMMKQSGARKPRVPIVELPDLSVIAKAAGLKCRAYCSFSLWQVRNDAEERTALFRSILERLVELLGESKTDPSMAILRDALLDGKPLSPAVAFGVRGRAIAFEVPDPNGGALVLPVNAMLWPSREPLLFLSLRSDWLGAEEFLDGRVAVFGPKLSGRIWGKR